VFYTCTCVHDNILSKTFTETLAGMPGRRWLGVVDALSAWKADQCCLDCMGALTGVALATDVCMHTSVIV